MRMEAPIQKLIEKFKEKGLVKVGIISGNKRGLIALHRPELLGLPIRDIILRYKMILSGLLNYYSFVNNRPRLGTIYWILRSSLAKTLAAKLQLNSVRKVYLKFGIGINYKIPETDVEINFKCPDLSVTPKAFKGGMTRPDQISVLD